MADSTPIKRVKPVVIPVQYLIWAPLASAFAALFPAFFAFVVSNIIIRPDEPVATIGIVVYIITFAAVMYLLYLKAFKELQVTTYTIYPDRLEYYEGFLNRQQRTAVFDQVIDIHLTEGLLQQTKNAGTIVLITQQLVSAGNAKLSNRRVVLSNIPSPQEIYDLLRSLALDKSKPLHDQRADNE